MTYLLSRAYTIVDTQIRGSFFSLSLLSRTLEKLDIPFLTFVTVVFLLDKLRDRFNDFPFTQALSNKARYDV